MFSLLDEIFFYSTSQQLLVVYMAVILDSLVLMYTLWAILQVWNKSK